MRKAGVEMTEIDTKKGIDVDTVKSIVDGAGGVKAVMNIRHATVKEKGWVDAPPDADTFARAVVKDVNLLRRPILQVGKKFIVGFDKAAYSKLK